MTAHMNINITSHKKQRHLKHALLLYDKMQEGQQSLNRFSIVTLLKACSSLKDLDLGSKLHGEISKMGLLRKDLYVGNALVDMYAKCNLLGKAKQIFDMLPARDVVSWNTLISGYANYEHEKEALDCFYQMQYANVQPNAFTYTCCLKACGSVKDISKGRELHALILRQGLLGKNAIVCNALIEMYARCGYLEKAREIFNKFPVQDVFSWNALISGYLKHNECEQALEFFRKMQMNGHCPDRFTFINILKVCGALGAIEEGKEVHAEIARKGFLESHLVIGNALVDMYAKCGFLLNAHEVFKTLQIKDVITWTTLIGGYARQEYADDALDCYMQMRFEGFNPNAVTLVCILQACSTVRDIHMGIETHAEAARKGYIEGDINLPVCNALIDMYGKCGSILKAREVFEKLLIPDAISWTSLIMTYSEYQYLKEALMLFERMRAESVSPSLVTYVCSLKSCGSIGDVDKGRKIHAEICGKGFLLPEEELMIGNVLIDMYAHCGCLLEAREVLEMLPSRDVVSWTAMIAGYVKHGCGEDALNSFEKMKVENIAPNAATLISLLKACCTLGATEKGQEIHIDIARKGFLERDPVVGNALIGMYAKCGALGKAQEVFDKLLFRDVITWNALIAGYTQSGDSENAFGTFEKMRLLGEQPDMVTFVSILNACTHVGMLDKGQVYYEVMSKDYGITPMFEHHTCMVNLISQAGHLARAMDVANQMVSHPDHVMWQCVLDASRKCGNVKLGKKAYEYVMKLEDKDPSPYVSICSLYADQTLTL